MKMINTLSPTTVVALLLFVSPAQAGIQDDNFEASELQNIRNISQSILKSRGQERKAILAETQPLREEVLQIRAELKQAAVLNDTKLVLTTNTNLVSTDTFEIPARTTTEKVSRWWRSITKSNKSANQNTSITKNKSTSSQMLSLDKAKSIINKRKTNIDNKMPSFWQLGQDADPKQVRIRQALVHLESDIIAAGNEKGTKRRKKIEAIIAKLDGKQVDNEITPAIEPERTISSITKHYRK